MDKINDAECEGFRFVSLLQNDANKSKLLAKVQQFH